MPSHGFSTLIKCLNICILTLNIIFLARSLETENDDKYYTSKCTAVQCCEEMQNNAVHCSAVKWSAVHFPHLVLGVKYLFVVPAQPLVKKPLRLHLASGFFSPQIFSSYFNALKGPKRLVFVMVPASKEPSRSSVYPSLFHFYSNQLL